MRYTKIVCILALLSGIFSAQSAGAIVVRDQRSFYESPRRESIIVGVDEPDKGQFPLYFYIFLDENHLRTNSRGQCRKKDNVEVPHYFGMLKVDKDYSATFIPEEASDGFPPSCSPGLLETAVWMQNGITDWKDLSYKLHLLLFRYWATLVMAGPGDTPDADFIPRFKETVRIMSTQQLDKLIEEYGSPKGSDIGKTLANPREGMRILQFDRK